MWLKVLKKPKSGPLVKILCLKNHYIIMTRN